MTLQVIKAVLPYLLSFAARAMLYVVVGQEAEFGQGRATKRKLFARAAPVSSSEFLSVRKCKKGVEENLLSSTLFLHF